MDLLNGVFVFLMRFLVQTGLGMILIDRQMKWYCRDKSLNSTILLHKALRSCSTTRDWSIYESITIKVRRRGYVWLGLCLPAFCR